MARGPAQIREDIEEHLRTVLGALDPAWRVSAGDYHTFPGADPQQREPLCFSVGLPESELMGRKGTAGAGCVTSFGVKFLSRIRADRRPADVGLGYEREELVMAALRSLSQGTVTPQRITREVIGDGTVYYGHITGIIVHAYP